VGVIAEGELYILQTTARQWTRRRPAPFRPPRPHSKLRRCASALGAARVLGTKVRTNIRRRASWRGTRHEYDRAWGNHWSSLRWWGRRIGVGHRHWHWHRGVCRDDWRTVRWRRRACAGAYCASGMDIVGAINGAAICWAAVPIDDAGYWSRDCWKYHGEFCGVECCCTWLGGEVGIGVGAC
jgi:hypothetical protein